MMEAIRPLRKQNFRHPDVVEKELEGVVAEKPVLDNAVHIPERMPTADEVYAAIEAKLVDHNGFMHRPYTGEIDIEATAAWIIVNRAAGKRTKANSIINALTRSDMYHDGLLYTDKGSSSVILTYENLLWAAGLSLKRARQTLKTLKQKAGTKYTPLLCGAYEVSMATCPAILEGKTNSLLGILDDNPTRPTQNIERAMRSNDMIEDNGLVQSSVLQEYQSGAYSIEANMFWTFFHKRTRSNMQKSIFDTVLSELVNDGLPNTRETVEAAALSMLYRSFGRDEEAQAVLEKMKNIGVYRKDGLVALSLNTRKTTGYANCMWALAHYEEGHAFFGGSQ